MIVFDLICLNGHTFEGWFDDSNAFEDQQKKGMLICPVCSDGCISKALSGYSIKFGYTEKAISVKKKQIEVLERKISTFLEQNFENVGHNFAAEALKIHYGVSEVRNIRGTSTPEEEKILKDEGIEFVKIPSLTNDPETSDP